MINRQDSRHRIKRSNLTGVVPTVPTSSDFTDGSWLNTDLRSGELFWNEADNQLFIGATGQAFEIALVGGTGSGNNLEQTLAIGNNTGTYSIVMDTNTSILSSNGGSQIDLDYFSTPGEISISTDNGIQAESYIYMTPTTNEIGSAPGGLISLGTNVNINMAASGRLFSRSGNAGTNFSGRYNVSGSEDIIVFTNNATQSYTTQNSNKPLVSISSQNSTLGTASYNSVILGGSDNYNYAPNNVISAGTFVTVSNAGNNQVSGNQILIDSSHGNLVGGQYHSITGNTSYVDSNLVVGEAHSLFNSGANIVGGGGYLSGGNSLTASSQNNVSGSYNLLLNSSGNNVSGSNNVLTTNTFLYGNNVSGSNNKLEDLSINNNVSGNQNQLNNSGTNIVGGLLISLTQSNTNIVSGQNNQLNNSSFNNLSGENQILGTSSLNNVSGSYHQVNNSTDNNVSGSYHQVNDSHANNVSGGSHSLINSTDNNIFGGFTTLTDVGSSIFGGVFNNVVGPIQSMLQLSSNDNASNISGYGKVINPYTTTNATPVVMSVNKLSVQSGYSYQVRCTVIASDTSGNSKQWSGSGIIKNVGGTTTLVSAITLTSTVADVSMATATITVAANDIDDTLEFTATGILATTIHWGAQVDYEYVKFA